MTDARAPGEAATPVGQVLHAIDAVGRRLFTVRLLRHWYVWSAGCVGTAAITTAVRRPPPSEAVPWLALALVASLALAWCTARYRRPKAAAAARAIDAALDLRGLVQAARELAGDDDAVSALIVRNAARRVTGLAPARLVPLRRPGRRAASGLALAAVAWLAAVSLAERVAPSTGLENQAGGPGGVTSLTPVTGASPEPADTIEGAPKSEAAGAASQNETPAAQSGQPAQAAERARDGSPQPPDVPAADGTAVQDVARQDGPDASGSRGGSGEGTTGARGGETGGEPQGGAPGTRAETGAGGRSGAAGGRGSAADASATPGGPRLGGGVAGGEALAEAPRTTAGGGQPADANYEVRYRAARARAESPGGQARIPPDLRRLVQDYFIAIGPGAPE